MAQRWFSKISGNLEDEINQSPVQPRQEQSQSADQRGSTNNYGEELPSETTPLVLPDDSEGRTSSTPVFFKSPVAFPKRDEDYNYNDDYDDDIVVEEEEEEDDEAFLSIEEKAARFDHQSLMTERLSVRLLDVPDDDSDMEEEILRDELNLSRHTFGTDRGDGTTTEQQDNTRRQRSQKSSRESFTGIDMMQSQQQEQQRRLEQQYGRLKSTTARANLYALVSLALAVVVLVTTLLILGAKYVGPPKQPIGPYVLVERQEGEEFFGYYNFYEGRDSVGSNGYLNYVSRETAVQEKIINITYETDSEDIYALEHEDMTEETKFTLKEEPFVYMGSSPTKEGPRNSIRLEGKRRFNRGLFILDLRHMPAGCGTWPAFWLTDEANWPVNGEIDIVEGVNFQDTAKVALHSTRTCTMNDIPAGVSTGTWDTAQGIPDRKTGIPDMTLRYATNCFVYDPHQWLNQGCVAVDLEGNSLGVPVNQQGGGVYVLEWDPINRHIRSWVFSPHTKVPDNIRDAIRTASETDVSKRVVPDPTTWPLPYAYFAIGQGTDCPSSHFRNMRLVFNLAFCGSVSGNRYWIDCKEEAKKFKTCNDYIKSNPKELSEAYWKVRGVYVYERGWEKAWL